MQDLKVTLVQAELDWENIPQNLNRLKAMLNAIQEPTDLIVLPEMFSTGFSMNAPELAESMDGSAVSWLRRQSARRNVDMVGSLIIKDNGYYNRLVWARPDESVRHYDKRHLFRMSGEEKVYSQGDSLLTVELHGWRIRPFICYDLRFPVWTRNPSNPYDLALFTANWPAARSHHWCSLLQARAIENLSYVVGVNRVGIDGNRIEYNGQSSVIDPMGNILFQKKDRACVHTARLSYSLLQEYRQSFPAWMDRDPEADGLFHESSVEA